MGNGLIGQNGTTAPWSVVVAIKHVLEPAQIQNHNLMAQIALEKILKHKFAMMILAQLVLLFFYPKIFLKVCNQNHSNFFIFYNVKYALHCF